MTNTEKSLKEVDVDIDTGMGEYKAVEVTTENKSGQVDKAYYARNVGLIKTVSDKDGMNVTSTLKEIQENFKLKQNIRIYYPQVTDTDYVLLYQNVEVEFATNDITRNELEKVMKVKSTVSGTSPLSDNAKINSLYLNDDGMVYIDFNSSLVEDMNCGSGFESILLQSITDTIGGYYGADQVYITINNEPYSGSHIVKDKGEGFKVDYSKVLE